MCYNRQYASYVLELKEKPTMRKTLVTLLLVVVAGLTGVWVGAQTVLRYTDTHNLSAEAQESIEWAAVCGIMHGYGTEFRPHQELTRAQFVVVMRRWSLRQDTDPCAAPPRNDEVEIEEGPLPTAPTTSTTAPSAPVTTPPTTSTTAAPVTTPATTPPTTAATTTTTTTTVPDQVWPTFETCDFNGPGITATEWPDNAPDRVWVHFDAQHTNGRYYRYVWEIHGVGGCGGFTGQGPPLYGPKVWCSATPEPRSYVNRHPIDPNTEPQVWRPDDLTECEVINWDLRPTW